MYLLFYRGKFIEKVTLVNALDIEGIQKYPHGTYIHNVNTNKWYRLLNDRGTMKDRGIHHSHVPKELKMMVLLLK